jgi:hypothetical protein
MTGKSDPAFPSPFISSSFLTFILFRHLVNALDYQAGLSGAKPCQIQITRIFS